MAAQKGSEFLSQEVQGDEEGREDVAYLYRGDAGGSGHLGDRGALL